MNIQRNLEFKVGIVSLLAIILLILGISFGRGVGVSVTQKTIKFRFDNSGGIQVSNPIVVNGVKRGVVTLIRNDNGGVYIEGTIDDVSDLKSDATAEITILEITGGKKIEINPGVSSEKFNPQNEIPGITRADFTTLVNQGGDMLNDIHSLIVKLDTISSSLAEITANQKFVNNVNSAIENASEIMQMTRQLLVENSDNIELSLKNLRILSTDLVNITKKNEPRLDSLMTQLELTLKNSGKLISKADTSINVLNSILDNVNNITNEIKQGEGLATKIIYDKNFSSRLDSTLTVLFDFLVMVKQHGININARLGTRP
ncbi:MAG: MlaD family protein [Candidatus Kapabacteria bacterium]|nr:MlaD family protein [Candidatus Kapabacteria bacterium]